MSAAVDKDWRHASQKEIDAMTFDEAKRIVEKQIELGHGKGDFRPRAHMTKALEIVLKMAEANYNT
jgi:hypothetical protein